MGRLTRLSHGLHIYCLLLSTAGLLFWPIVTTAATHTRANPAYPPNGQTTLDLQELWRAGGEDGDVLLGSIRQICSGPNDLVYVLDDQLFDVKGFDNEGTHVATVSRQGEGPGEIQQPTDLTILDNGTLGLTDGFPGKLLRITPDDVPIDELHPVGDPTEGGFGSISRCTYRDGFFMMECGNMVIDTNTGAMTRATYLRLTDADGANARDLAVKNSAMNFSEPKFIEKDEFFVDDGWALGPDGTGYAALDRDSYTISVFDNTGELVRLITRAYEPRRRSDEEMKLPGSDMAIIVDGEMVEIEKEIEKTDPCIHRLHVDESGRLWVLSQHGRLENPEGVLETWDVFDAKGHFDHQVVIKPPEAIEQGRSYFLNNGQLVLVKGHVAEDVLVPDGQEPETLEIICYAIR